MDREILKGLLIPPELVDAATVGSGYSGRSIPAQVFFTMEDEIAELIVQGTDNQVIRPLVDLNFGPKVKYEILLNSLAKLVWGEDKGGGDKGGDSAKGDDEDAGAPDKPADAVRLSLEQRIRELADATYPDLAPVVPITSVRLSATSSAWKSYRGPHGGHGWQSTRDPSIIRYQAEQPSDREAGETKEETTRHPDHDGGFDAVAAKLPDAAKTRGLVGKAKAFYERFFTAATNVMMKLHGLAPEVLDTADDFSKIFYAGRGDAAGHSVDPMVSHFGVSSNTVAVVASHVLGSASTYLRKKLRLALDESSAETLAVNVVKVFAAFAEEIEGLPVPSVEEVKKWLEERSKTRLSFDPIRLAATHAPKGGVTIGGTEFVGGQFIPGDVVAKATPEEKKKLEKGGNDTKSAGKAPKPTAGKAPKPTAGKAKKAKMAAKKAKMAAKKAKMAEQARQIVGGKLKKTTDRAFTGEAVGTQIDIRLAGAIGEEVLIQFLKMSGFADAVQTSTYLDSQRNNLPFDLIHDHQLIEAKTGQSNNPKGVWALKYDGRYSKKQKAKFAKMTPEKIAAAKKKINKRKVQAIHDRKNAFIQEINKKLGFKVNADMMTVIINHETKTADIFQFDGVHDRIPFRSEMTQKAYVGSFKYGG